MMFYLIRFIHIIIGIFFIGCLLYIWYAALSATFTLYVILAIAAIIFEGLLLWANKGECPVTGLQKKYGDDKGFFDLFLPEPVLPFVVPLFAILTITGVLLLLINIIN